MRFFLHPLLILFGVLAFYFALSKFFLALLIAVLLHEGAHILMARCYGVRATRVTILPFGGAIDLAVAFLTPKQRRLILLAGPLANLSIAILGGAILWVFPVAFGWVEYLVTANFIVGFLNVLPIYPLDGGKLLATRFNVRLMFLWSNIVVAVFLLVALCCQQFGVAFFLVLLLLQINSSARESIYQDKFAARVARKTGKFVCCAVQSTTTIFDAYKMVHRTRPTQFVVTDRADQQFFENELEQWLLAAPLQTTCGEMLSKAKSRPVA